MPKHPRQDPEEDELTQGYFAQETQKVEVQEEHDDTISDMLRHFVWWIQTGLTPHAHEVVVFFRNGTCVRYDDADYVTTMNEFAQRAMAYLGTKRKTLEEMKIIEDDEDYEEDEDATETIATPLSTEKDGVTFERIAKANYENNDLRCFSLARVCGPVATTPSSIMFLMFRMEQTRFEMKNLASQHAFIAEMLDARDLQIVGIIRAKRFWRYDGKAFSENDEMLTPHALWHVNSNAKVERNSEAQDEVDALKKRTKQISASLIEILA
jgi:hypothetical protein